MPASQYHRGLDDIPVLLIGAFALPRQSDFECSTVHAKVLLASGLWGDGIKQLGTPGHGVAFAVQRKGQLGRLNSFARLVGCFGKVMLFLTTLG